MVHNETETLLFSEHYHKMRQFGLRQRQREGHVIPFNSHICYMQNLTRSLFLFDPDPAVCHKDRRENSLSLVETGRILLVLELRFFMAMVSFQKRRKLSNER